MSRDLGDSAIRRLFAAAVCALLLTAGAAWAEKKDENPNIRSVQGVVNDAQGGVVNGAVVQLKNTKTLQIRSFITRDNGAYYFHGLSTDVDYEIRADFDGASSAARTLSSFDTRKQPVVNLKLATKK
ncbi:MAG: carboxypeptidase-like regulatory domain-containing protein [Bryobacteraceae bacterium]